MHTCESSHQAQRLRFLRSSVAPSALLLLEVNVLLAGALQVSLQGGYPWVRVDDDDEDYEDLKSTVRHILPRMNPAAPTTTRLSRMMTTDAASYVWLPPSERTVKPSPATRAIWAVLSIECGRLFQANVMRKQCLMGIYGHNFMHFLASRRCLTPCSSPSFERVTGPGKGQPRCGPGRVDGRASGGRVPFPEPEHR